MTRFDQPVGSQADRDKMPWSSWWDAAPYGTYYLLRPPSTYAYHTGADLNSNVSGADVNAPVYASAKGEVVWAAAASGFQDLTVCIKHPKGGDNGADVWTRYSHVKNLLVSKGQKVERGQQLANISDYNDDGPSSDHLHFDISRKDLGQYPADWPGLDLARLQRDYISPKPWIEQHRAEDDMSGAYARNDYVGVGRTIHGVWMGDGRWPQYGPSTNEQFLKVINTFVNPTIPNSPKHGFINSYDEMGLRLVATSGAEGTRRIHLWGFPNDKAVRDEYLKFFNDPLYMAGPSVQWHAWSELFPQPPSGKVRVTAADGVKARISPSTSATSIGTLLPGAEITPLRKDGDWYAYTWEAGNAATYKVGSTTARAEAFSMAQYFEAVP